MRFASEGLKDEGCFMNRYSAAMAMIQTGLPAVF
jgi:hypothetical protein